MSKLPKFSMTDQYIKLLKLYSEGIIAKASKSVDMDWLIVYERWIGV